MTWAAVDWTAVTIAGGFITGAIIATVATLHLARTIFGIRDKHDKD